MTRSEIEQNANITSVQPTTVGVVTLVVLFALVTGSITLAQSTPSSGGGSTPSSSTSGGGSSASPTGDTSADKQCPAETATAKYNKDEPENKPYQQTTVVAGNSTTVTIQNLYGKPCDYSMSQQAVVKGKCVAKENCRCQYVKLVSGTFTSCTQTPSTTSAGSSGSSATPAPSSSGPTLTSKDGSTQLPSMWSNIQAQNPVTPGVYQDDGSTIGDLPTADNTANAGGSQYSDITSKNAPVTTSFGGSTQAINGMNTSVDQSQITPSYRGDLGGLSPSLNEDTYLNLNAKLEQYRSQLDGSNTNAPILDGSFDVSNYRLSSNIEDLRPGAFPVAQTDQPLTQFPPMPTIDNGYLNSISFDTPDYTFSDPAARMPSNTTFGSAAQIETTAGLAPQAVSVPGYYYPQSEGSSPITNTLHGAYGTSDSVSSSFLGVMASPFITFGNWFAGLFR